jgi:hypothetical protein
LYIKSYSD